MAVEEVCILTQTELRVMSRQFNLPEPQIHILFLKLKDFLRSEIAQKSPDEVIDKIVYFLNEVHNKLQTNSSHGSSVIIKRICDSVLAELQKLGVDSSELESSVYMTDMEVFLWWCLFDYDEPATVKHVVPLTFTRIQIERQVKENIAFVPSPESIMWTAARLEKKFPDDANLIFHVNGDRSVLIPVGILLNRVEFIEYGKTETEVLGYYSVPQIRALANQYLLSGKSDEVESWWRKNQDQISADGVVSGTQTDENEIRDAKRAKTTRDEPAPGQGRDGSIEGEGSSSGRRREQSQRSTAGDAVSRNGEGGSRQQRRGRAVGVLGVVGGVALTGWGSGGRVQSEIHDTNLLTEEEESALDIQKVSEFIASNNEVVNLIEDTDDDEAGPSQRRVELHEATREYADRQRGVRENAARRVNAPLEAARRVERRRLEIELADAIGAEGQADARANADLQGDDDDEAGPSQSRVDRELAARTYAERQADARAHADRHGTGWGAR